MTKPADTSFLASANGPFVEELYAKFASDPASVDPDWAAFFSDLRDEAPEVLKALEGASWAPRETRVIGNGAAKPAEDGEGAVHAMAPAADGVDLRQATRDSIQALTLIRSYRVRGHLYCDLDPLKLEKPAPHSELDPRSYGFTEADYDRPIYVNTLGFERASLRQIVDALRETYCGTVGVEYMHITSAEEKVWIQDRIEAIHNQTDFTERGKETIHERLVEAESFERFLHVRYPGTKRFGLDGSESLIPALEQILKRGSQLGVEEVVLGMPHRGRLSVLAHVMLKPYAAIFAEFRGMSYQPEEVGGSGDVKYHLGASADREFDGVKVHLSLAANPSHLEAVDPVVVGKVRAKQRQRGDLERRRVLSILMHGDAAFAGQGVVAETFGLSDIAGYRTGGTIHLVVNNQIGFTTSPAATRASRYPTEIAKSVQAPIFHVNGDDVEAVVHVARIATEFRDTFRKDVVLDTWSYRRFGHNESDEPAFTQPVMYKAIADHPSVASVYGERLVEEGLLTAEEVERVGRDCRQRLEDAFEAAKSYKPNKADWLEGEWAEFTTAPSLEERRGKTAVTREALDAVGRALTTVPDDFNLNPKLNRFIDARKAMFEAGEGVDWATAEALAFGTILAEGYMVRLSGQDCRRGTFSQRHAVLIDQETQEAYTPLAHICEGQERLAVRDSPLAEASVLGFEYGMSLADPNMLVLWEAQFGDFANGAQFIIDQFHFFRRDQVAAHVRVGAAVAARPRGPGAGAFLGTVGALSPALRRRQHAGVQHHHACQLFPRAEAANSPQLPEAPDRHDAEIAAQAQALRIAPRRHVRRRLISPGPSRKLARSGRTPMSAASSCAAARCSTISSPRGRRGRSAILPWSGSNSSTPSPISRSGRSLLAILPPRWSGARRSRATWGPGPIWTGASKSFLATLDVRADRPVYAGRPEAGFHRNRAWRPARP